MAAFSYDDDDDYQQNHHPFLVDSAVLFPLPNYTSPIINIAADRSMPSSLQLHTFEVHNLMASYFDSSTLYCTPFYSDDHHHQDNLIEEICVDFNGAIRRMSDKEIENEHSVILSTEKLQSTTSHTSPMVILNDHHQPLDTSSELKKWKAPEEGSSSNYHNSTDCGAARRRKRQKKTKQVDRSNEEEEKLKIVPGQEELADPSRGYIHVRARRGQATDSHSLAERARREKISEKMKVLQALVPGCDKVTGKALMLDEIINYVQSMKHQVEFLSRKLAFVEPMFGVLDVEGAVLEPQEFGSMQFPQQPLMTTPTLMEPYYHCTPSAFTSSQPLTTSCSAIDNNTATTFPCNEIGSAVLEDLDHNILNMALLGQNQRVSQFPTQDTVEAGSSLWEETGNQRQCCFIHQSPGLWTWTHHKQQQYIRQYSSMS